jgi:hypothetical protein
VAFVALGISACSKASGPGSPGRLDAAGMRRIGTVDERFTGSVIVDELFSTHDPSRTSAGKVTFEPSARTALGGFGNGEAQLSKFERAM